MAKRNRQTKDDFPSELLYSKERLWVRPGRGRTARIGLNLPALSERVANVYHLDLLPRGYVILGGEFGAVDLDTARMPLIGPLTARIERVNWEAVEDPLLVMTDPFGDGWLYDVHKVKAGAFEQLLDRDAYWSFLEFERLARRLGLKPVLGGLGRIERGGVWYDDLRVTFGGLTVLTGRMLKLGRNATFTPQWSRGDSWVVEVSFEQPSMAMVPESMSGPETVKLRFRYEVTDEDFTEGGESLYEVSVIEVDGPPPQTKTVLYIAKEDFGLRRIDEVSAHDPSRRTMTPNDWGRESYVELRQRREVLVDLPYFPLENKDERRTLEVAGEPPLKLEASFPDAKTMALACEAPLGGGTLRTEQTWHRGRPWWSEARRSLDGRVLMSAELVHAEGA